MTPVGHEELGVLGPAIGALVSRTSSSPSGSPWAAAVSICGRAIADVAVEDDQGSAGPGLPKDRKRVLDPLEIVGIADPQHVPAVSLEARRDIFGEGDACLALDGEWLLS